MASDILHPDALHPGDTVGSFTILGILGAGGLGRVFKVQHERKVYALKMATRLPGAHAPDEEDVDGRCVREASALLAREHDPHLPRVLHVGRWPDSEEGFLFVVMEYVDGWSFHEWRYEKHPSAAQLVDVLLPLVRTLDEMHQRGMHHRDLHAGNVIIRKKDTWPFLLDLGSVSMPGARTLTQGMPPINQTIIPPEALEQAVREGDEARFEGGAAVDLYALGVLLYSALTDGHPINLALPPDRLAAAIRLRKPRPPHRVNPHAPESLSLIAMRLLEKRPEDRYESAHALYQALWEANKQRKTRAWKASLDLPESGPAPISDEEWEERKRDEERALRALDVQARPEGDDSLVGAVVEVSSKEELFVRQRPVVARSRRTWRWARHPMAWALWCALVASVGLYPHSRTLEERPPIARTAGTKPGQEVAPPGNPPEADRAATPPVAVSLPAAVAPPATSAKDDAPVTTPENAAPSQMQPKRARSVGKALALTVTCAGLACTGTKPQVRSTPPPEECPPGAAETMKQWGIREYDRHTATFDRERGGHYITVSEGPRPLYIVGGRFEGLPSGAELLGRLYLGDRIYGRYTQVRTKDGEVFPICMDLTDPTDRKPGLLRKPPGNSDTARGSSVVDVRVVGRFE